MKKQRAVFQRKNVCQNGTSTLLGQLDKKISRWIVKSNTIRGVIFSNKICHLRHS
jgi:hypothetical protein